MPEISIKITNLPQIKSAFNKAPGLMTKELNTAIAKSIFTIKRGSMINTPVLTGRLRASTYTNLNNLRGEIGTNTNYDVFIHEGTKFMKARPYLRDAVEASNEDVNKFFSDAVQNVLDKIGDNV